VAIKATLLKHINQQFSGVVPMIIERGLVKTGPACNLLSAVMANKRCRMRRDRAAKVGSSHPSGSARSARARFCRVAAVLLAASVLQPAIAATATPGYPARPIRWVVAFPAGGGTDLVARTIAPRLTELLGQPIVIDNRAGASGVIGAEIVARATPDGYTLLFGTSGALGVLPLLSSKLPFDTVRDFAPVSMLSVIPQLLVVHPGISANSVKELIALAKSMPGKLNYASSGVGSPNHIAAELFSYMAGVNMTHVPYKGAAPSISDLLGGQVQLLINPIQALVPHVKSGRLRALGVGSATRSVALPEVPTIAEAGLPGYEYVLWYGMFAPKQTPAPIVTRLHAHVASILANPDIVKQFATQGVDARSAAPEEFVRYMRAESDRLARVIKSAKIKLE
jgi:tripartite-type tricarboxylate transporter receptor subunit TctC